MSAVAEGAAGGLVPSMLAAMPLIRMAKTFSGRPCSAWPGAGLECQKWNGTGSRTPFSPCAHRFRRGPQLPWRRLPLRATRSWCSPRTLRTPRWPWGSSCWNRPASPRQGRRKSWPTRLSRTSCSSKVACMAPASRTGPSPNPVTGGYINIYYLNSFNTFQYFPFTSGILNCIFIMVFFQRGRFFMKLREFYSAVFRVASGGKLCIRLQYAAVGRSGQVPKVQGRGPVGPVEPSPEALPIHNGQCSSAVPPGSQHQMYCH